MLLPKGLIPAPLTPFKENFDLDEEGLRKHVEYVAQGSGGIVGPAVFSELPSLTFDEWKRYIDILVEVGKKARVPVWGYFGAESFEKTLPYARYAVDAGADGLMLLAPYYHRYTQEAGYQYFKEFVAEFPHKPFIIYPSLQTANPFLPKTIARLAEIDNIVGLKLTVGFTIHHVIEIARLTEELEFVLVTGSTTALYPLWTLKPKASFSPESSWAHREALELWGALQKGNMEQAREIHNLLAKVGNALMDPDVHFFNIPARHKAAMKLLGKSMGPVRRPLRAPSADQIEEIRKVLEETGLLKPGAPSLPRQEVRASRSGQR